ncbi:CBASS cGAMP synthase [Brevundimonas sp.]|uniref:CBASS cGAMP synthase n=1 Tax=Brevundimonas sp. TaxID=1871086 RepID=UPI0026322B0B|nr:CBASS cGAMP synthase [Brevundimonas sp.]
MQVQHLFYSTDADRSTLFRRITPTQPQREQQQERWQDLRDYLVDDLGEATGYRISSWLQGSYKFGTQIRPARKGDEFDIDLGIYFNWAGGPDTTGEDPTDLKDRVQRSIRRYAEEAQDDVKEVVEPAKERCSRIRFSGDFHIDVPTYHLDPDRDARDLATETLGWEVSDPKQLWVWFQNQFAEEDTAQVRRLIRYVKMWAALKLPQRPASVLLTVLAAQAYMPLRADQVTTDDLGLRNLADAILQRLTWQTAVPNPVNPTENLNRLSPGDHAAFLEGLRRLIHIADAALAAHTEQETALIWTEAFDAFFPAPVAAPVGNALVPVAFDPQVEVQARPGNSQAVFAGTNRIGPIPKDCTITFTLINANHLPAGAQVRWFVRNEGEEAELTNDLGHVAGQGTFATEHSAYQGTHHMDVVIISALGAVLGFRRVPVQITGIPMPRRNTSRPGYRRFAAKR